MFLKDQNGTSNLEFKCSFYSKLLNQYIQLIVCLAIANSYEILTRFLIMLRSHVACFTTMIIKHDYIGHIENFITINTHCSRGHLLKYMDRIEEKSYYQDKEVELLTVLIHCFSL